MLKAYGDFAVLQDWSDRDHPVFVRIDRSGRRRPLGALDAHCRVYEAGNRLVLEYGENRLLRLGPEDDFVPHTFVRWEGTGTEPLWTFATLSLLGDIESLRLQAYEYDRDALMLPDPGYSEPVDAALLPGGDEIAIFIVRCQHFVLFNRRTGKTRRIALPRYGSGNPAIVADALWFSNYDVLCCYEPASGKLTASEVLQPPFRDPKFGIDTSAFIGEPLYVAKLSGWLIPRPYAGDILLVRADTMAPTAHIAFDGQPYEAALLDDGCLIVSTYPDPEIRISDITELRPL